MDAEAADATRPPPASGPAWPAAERLPDAAVVLARPDPAQAPAVFRLAADPALWVDVPEAGRTTSVTAQRDDLERFAAHWDRYGFGYWLAWSATGDDDPEEAVGGDLLGLGGLRWLWWRDDWVLNVYIRLAARAQGRGIARRLLEIGIERLDESLDIATPVVVRTRPTNEPMIGLARRLGFDDLGTEERELGTYRVLARELGT